MTVNRLPFRITALHATVPEGVSVAWRGKELPSGPLRIELHEGSGETESRGELDYGRRQALAEFHIRVEIPELVDLLQTLGVDPGLTRPVYAVVRSEGKILDDHSFNLAGRCRMGPHELFDGARACMLPGH